MRLELKGGMSSLARMSWVIPLVVLGTGCVRGPGLFGLGVVTGAAVVASTAPYGERVVVVETPPPVLMAVPAPSSAKLPPPEPRRFDATAAKGVLDGIDLSECHAMGLPRGYLHARATFANTGAVTKVVVDAPSGLSPSAVSCVGRAVSSVAVPAYDGDEGVTMGASWFVP